MVNFTRVRQKVNLRVGNCLGNVSFVHKPSNLRRYFADPQGQQFFAAGCRLILPVECVIRIIKKQKQ